MYSKGNLRSSRFPSFSRRREQRSERAKEHAWGEQNMERNLWEGVSDDGEWVGRKGRLFPLPHPLPLVLIFLHPLAVSFPSHASLEMPDGQATLRASIFI